MTELIGALLVVLDRNQQDHLERKMQSDPIPGINFAPLSSKLRADSLPSILNPSNLAIALTPLLPPISLGARVMHTQSTQSRLANAARMVAPRWVESPKRGARAPAER